MFYFYKGLTFLLQFRECKKIELNSFVALKIKFCLLIVYFYLDFLKGGFLKYIGTNRIIKYILI